MKLLPIFAICLFCAISCAKTPQDTPTPPTSNPNTPDPDPVVYAVPFAGVPNTTDIAMYEVNMRAFSVAGTFKGVEARLDSIKALGINTLWLMPIHPIGVVKNAGQLGSPYSVKNYKEVNPEYGTLEDLQNLVTAAHNRNMAVIIDWVANHTSWDNPWITAHTDWYTKDANGNIIIPAGTNWADVADLDFSNALMRKFMINAMKYWVLKANIDGFRCDYADGVPADFWKQAIDTLKTIPNRKYILLAEGSMNTQFTAGFEMNYSWSFYDQLRNIYRNNLATSGLFTVNTNDYAAVPSGVAKLRYSTNHDQSAWDDSPVVLYNGQAGAINAFVLSATIGGVPLIYNGQEVGRPDKTPFFSKSPINWNLNPGTLAAYKQIMAFRQSSNALKLGSIQVLTDAGNVVAFKRIYQSEEVLVLVNTKNSTTNYTLSGGIANTNWKNALDNSSVALGTALSLQPYQYFILKK